MNNSLNEAIEIIIKNLQEGDKEGAKGMIRCCLNNFNVTTQDINRLISEMSADLQETACPVQELETEISEVEAKLAALENILQDDSVSDDEWDAAKAQAMTLDGQRMDLRSKLSTLKCDIRVNAKLG